jgi:hypothetical protein
MANVNVWGPPAWSVLHGICGFCTPSLNSQHMQSIVNVNDYYALAKIFDLLRILLPCPLCLNSYIVFYKDLETEMKHSILQEIQLGNAFSFCYKLHTLVNEKLLVQRIGDVYLGQELTTNKLSLLKESFKRVQNEPTLLIVEKRYKSSDLHPFDEEDVWILLASFCIHIDKEKTDVLKRERVKAIHSFCGCLPPLLLLGTEYDYLVSRIQTLDSLFLALNPPDTSKALDLVCYAKYEKINHEKKHRLTDIYSVHSETWKDRQEIKQNYITALSVKSCSESCS